MRDFFEKSKTSLLFGGIELMFEVSVKAVGRQFSSEGTRNSAVLLRATYIIIAKIPIFKEA